MVVVLLIVIFFVSIFGFFLGVHYINTANKNGYAYLTLFLSIVGVLISSISLILTFFPLDSREKSQSAVYKSSTSKIEETYNTASDTTKSQDTTTDTYEKTDIKEEKILENSFSGSITKDGQADYYEYIPTVSGVYRFDFESNDVHTDYKFYIYLENGNKEADALYSSGGKTIRLIAEQQYRIIVEQYSGKPQYTINIGVPSEVKDVKDTVIKGNFSYTDQENQYTYTAPITGQYRFDFSSSNVDYNYDFNMYSSNNKKLVATSYLSEGKTVELVKDEVYTIIVKQHSGFLDYMINIGVPNEVHTISENSISGSLEYLDQLDRYTYVAPVTGKYRFDFYNNDIECSYGVQIYSSINEKLVDTSSLNKGKNIDLQEGETYRIEIVQDTGMEDYSINIGIPNDISNIEENTISGILNYIGQENKYLYTAPKTGNYEFVFEINDEKADYDFIVYSSNNKKIVEKYCSRGSKIISLEEGQVYTVVVKQNLGFPSYKINIIQP